ncbi:sigma-70 family RNA polymerase sigma factor [Aquimarina addita]|uniref:Sigma-70 family RNA polymerase sigma factor n=2 Tax=Aquimarina addita TaxID=870485 RepID=A0ABP7X871_9FLAO
MVAVLVKIFGIENLAIAEDVVQDALVSALENWKYRGIPDNPRAWLYRTAKNRAIDIIRRNKHRQVIDFSDPQRQLLHSEYTLTTVMDGYWQKNHIQDDFLGMMYACCHPEISPENQITLILKLLCGFSTKEVAKSFLTTEDTVSKRLYRTKEYFRKHRIELRIPSEQQIELRTNVVLSAIYLIFNEGYSSTHDNQLIRKDIISQAMHLCKSLLNNQKTQLPEVYALMSLMCFHTARIQSRITREGALVVLKDQNRRLWDQELIVCGSTYLNKASFGETVSTYHLEAAIAYEHCRSKDYISTNWNCILHYYDALLKIEKNPVVLLNRCLVILEIKGANAALQSIEEIKDSKVIDTYLYITPF